MSVGARPSDLPLPRPTPAADRRIREGLVRLALGACGAFSFATTLAIVLVLLQETRQFFALDEVTLLDFLLGSQWNPLLGGDKSFGIWPLVTGTLLVTCIAMTVAVPLGLLTAIYLSEYAAPAFRTVARPALEILAGIPTVVFGFFALREITPLLQSVFPSFEIYNAFSAGVAVGLLCVPIVSSLTEDALRAVPSHLRAAAFALGATRFEVATRVVVPAAGSGLVAAVPRPGRELAPIPGAPPSLLSPPAGCRFHPRCPRATERCAQVRPEWRAGVACHHPLEAPR